MSKNTIEYFASYEENLQNCLKFESMFQVSYVLSGLFDTSNFQIFHSCTEINNFGKSINGLRSSSPSFLLNPKNYFHNFQTISQKKGGLKYSIDKRSNPTSILFQPSTQFKDIMIIWGLISFPENIDKEEALFVETFRKVYLKGFKIKKSFYFGPDALDLYKKGIRFNMNYNADPISDFKL